MISGTEKMKLFWSPTSPFARKVVVLARERGIFEEIEIVPVIAANEPPELLAVNPCGKIPVLVGEEGPIPDSSLICEYLDASHGGQRLLAPDGAARWRALARMTRADAMLDAAILVRNERMRPENERSPDWEAKQMRKIQRGLDAFEAVDFGDSFGLGEIALACALGYLELRFAGDDLLASRPRLAGWLETVSRRESMRASAPPAG